MAETVPIEDQLRGARPRTLTVKGQEFNTELKKKIALAKDKEFRSKLVTYEELVHSCGDPDKIKQETLMMATYADSVIQDFYNWTELLQDTIQIQHASSRQSYLIDSWKTVHATALDQIQRLQEEETRTVYSQRSTPRSRSSTKSGSSTSSRRDTLIDCKAKRAALQEKLKFTAVIADQEKKLEQLKLQQELGAVIAQEVVYQKAVNEDVGFKDPEQPPLPTELHDVMSAFLNNEDAAGMASTPGISPMAPFVPETSPITSATTVPPESHFHPGHQDLHTSLPQVPLMPPMQEVPGTMHQMSHANITTTFSTGQQAPRVYPVTSTSQACLPPRGFCGNPPAFVPSPTPAYALTPQDYTQQLTDTLAKVSQLQRLPQAKPDIFKGDERDKTRFFLWENAFESLIDSAPVTAHQKLHLLYQYLDGKAKKVVEQLQYMVQDPERAYRHARSILKERFGHTAIISIDFERKLANWPKVGPNDAAAIEEFSDFLRQVEIASEHIDSLKVLNFPSKIQPLVEKLPGWFKTKWSVKVLKLQRKEGKDNFPSFKDFADEVSYHAERMNIPQLTIAPTASGRALPEHPKTFTRLPFRRPPVVALASKLSQSNHKETSNLGEETSHITQALISQAQQPGFAVTSDVYCFYHKRQSHPMNECDQFQKLSFQERKDFLMKNRICFNCISTDKHIARSCNKGKPECKICHQKHATILHDPSKHKGNDPSQAISACSQVCGQSNSARSCARIVLLEVSHQDDPSVKVPTYAVLDDQSTDVFVTDSLLDQLHVKGQEVNLEVNTIVGVNSIRTQRVNGLRIQDTEGHHQHIRIPSAYSQEHIPASHADIATPEIARNWKHLGEIAHNIAHAPNVEIGMLIGRNVPTAFQPLRIIYGKENEPWAEEYKFGWTIIGCVCPDTKKNGTNCATVNRITVQRENPQSFFNVPTSNNKEESAVSFATKQSLKDITTPQQLREMMQLDYNELHYSRTIRGTEQSESIEDKRFNDLLVTGIHTSKNGNWEMPLPLKTDNVILPNNRDQCLKRLLGLKRKLLKDGKVCRNYTEFIQKILDRNHASRVPFDELKTSPGKVWYLPHFDVYHPKKPEQVRVVFDCSSIHLNESLNKHLLQGPDMMNALIGVFSRFRKEEIAVTCDIEQMFHSFRVNPQHRDLLRFLWFENNDLSGQIIEYRMNVHLFGAISSPGVANFGLRQTAEAGREQFGQEAADFLQNDFYVDDGLKSFDTPEHAITVIKSSQAMCAAANLRLHKFASNSKTVLKAIPAEDRSKDLKDLDIHHDILPVQRSLGTFWCIESDTFGFRIELKDKPLTRRGILSTVSSVYDPLGMAAPVILVGKQILQDLCRDGVDWDDTVPEHVHSRWEKWRSELPLLEQIKLERCVKPPGFGVPVTVEIHSFSDASDVGLGQVSYLRLVNSSGQVNVSFLMGKARVAPVKQMSIPRLELTAAVISVNVASMLSKELNYKNLEEIYYTDSSVVLGYISNDARRFHIYVGNRVQHIRDRSKPSDWHYVTSEDNPADVASRGLTAKELLQHRNWFKGPDCLWESHTVVNSNPVTDLNPEDVEVKKVMANVCLSNSTQVQKMSDLPEERLTPAPPFTYTGMDVFGPWYIKEGRKELKRWGLIFTCLSSRAIHLETLNTMETDSFISALRRFINRRGKVCQLQSDQGTNFVGARNELAAALKEVNNDVVKNFLLSQDCDWIEFKMNAPSASHMGGVWERLIRTVRSVLSGLLKDHAKQLDDEALRTLFTEAENVVNSRPLTIENLSNPDAPEPITPNHLLTLKTKVVLAPPGNFSRPDLYSRKRWRRVQYLSNQFWYRWQREYCTLQQKRQKWTKALPNNQVGDIVLIYDESSPRNQWPLGKVTEVYPSADGLVRKVLLLVTQSGKKKYLERPIHKLILVYRQDEDGSQNNFENSDKEQLETPRPEYDPDEEPLQ